MREFFVIKHKHSILLFILVFFTTYQDSPLNKYLGVAGDCLLMPLSLIIFVLFLFYDKVFVKEEYLITIFKLCVLLIPVSIIGIVVWVILGNPMDVAGEYLPYKALKTILQYFSYPAYMYVLLRCLRNSGQELFEKYCFFTLVFQVAICLLELISTPFAFSWLHSRGIFPYYRIRLLTTESSTTSLIILVYSGISIYSSLRKNSKIKLAISVVSLIFLIITTGSKAIMISIGFGILLYIIMAAKKLNKSNIVGLFLAAGLLVISSETILPRLVSSFNVDIMMFTSVATRSFFDIIGVGIGLAYPFGVGCGAFLGVMLKAINQYIDSFERMFPMLNTFEIHYYLARGTDEALTAKSGLIQSTIYWGIIGTIVLLRNFGAVTKQLRLCDEDNTDFLIAVFWTSVFLVTFSNNFSFEFWLMYIYILFLGSIRNEKESEQY